MSRLTVTSSRCPARNSRTNRASQLRVQVTGDRERAWLESAPEYSPVDISWVPQVLPGTVRLDPEGNCAIDSPVIDDRARDTLARDYERALIECGLIPSEEGVRYLTRHYATTLRREAERLAKIDGSSVRVDNVHLIHATNSWAYWSDHRVTTAIGIPRHVRDSANGLSDPAAQMIALVWGSDSGAPSIGWERLAQLSEIVSTRELDRGVSRGHYKPATVTVHTVRLSNGEETQWFEMSAGYPEGYEFSLYEDVDALTATLPPDWRSSRPDLSWAVDELIYRSGSRHNNDESPAGA